ncbi:cell division protein FtsL [Phaeovulum vinaykumarii]|uniref:Cell division protein FtsL n=1 Tax=Phaeovulum vinaykumarii TaxID=407234 RepID=A0A1N7JTK1_9RHOB|nr:cell division protein FtsL [Phaeovulum vinaykumarii]SIS52673.1 hypothetical protein SAMN05421795_101323 [Phaeovulum vinaykumarii]SOB91317.1 hypothetical protein SAMN05878426_101323 [Phaeovulum vinaykumarii]
MRNLLYLTAALSVMGLAFWAYRENYRTQAAQDDLEDLQREIIVLREELGVLNAEWAYLNRPDRLRELVNLNFDRLALLPMQPEQMGALAQLPYPDPGLGGVGVPVDAIALSGAGQSEVSP